MKFNLRSCLVVFLAVSGLWLPAADTAQIDAETRRVESLSRSLADGGVAALLATALPAPPIHSQYFADRLVMREPERRALEQAKRDFGLKLAHALERMALEVQQRTDLENRARQATLLLDLAAWIKAPFGYGNYRLFSRCESIATVPLIYLTADLDFPLARVVALRDRIAPVSVERAFRVAVLNGEAQQPFIPSLSGSDSEQDELMQIAWGRGWQKMAEWFKSKGVPISRWRRDALPDDLAFFLDDEEVPGLLTAVNLWPFKRHNTVIFGHRDVQVRNVDVFILFREKVGSFPTQPPIWWKPNPDDFRDTALQAAFEYAVRDFRRPNGQSIGYSGPAMLYQRAIDGTVVDYETQLARTAEQPPRRNSKRNP